MQGVAPLLSKREISLGLFSLSSGILSVRLVEYDETCSWCVCRTGFFFSRIVNWVDNNVADNPTELSSSSLV